MSSSGVILDFELAAANESGLAVGAGLLAEHTDLTALGDKGCVSAPVAGDLWEHGRVHLLTLRRVSQHKQLPKSTKLTAHTLRIYINRLLDKPNILQIKPLAFPYI
jgi:hypothetical protein